MYAHDRIIRKYPLRYKTFGYSYRILNDIELLLFTLSFTFIQLLHQALVTEF